MTPSKTRPHKPMLAEWTSDILSLGIGFNVSDQTLLLQSSGTSSLHWLQERKVYNTPGSQAARLNGWNSVCSLLHSLCSTSCTNQTEEPCEPPGRCSINITSQAIIAGQGSVYAHNHCHKEQSSTQQDKPSSGRAHEMLQVRPPADCVLQ